MGRDTPAAHWERPVLLIFYTWRDICKHLSLSLCDRGRLPSLSTLFTLLLTGGISCRCMLSLFYLRHLSQSESLGPWGCQQEKPLADNTPNKPLCLHKMSRKVFDGWHKVSRLSPATSHLPLSESPPPRVWSPWKSDAGLKHLAAVSQRERGCGRGRGGAVLAECWQTSDRGPITFPACQEGVNPRGEAKH